MVTLGKYAVVSTIATVGVIYHAFHTREQFYPAMLYLSTSKISVVILGNMALVLTLLFGQLLKTVFLGTLREAEVERLYELSRQEIMETCLAMTIFRDEFNMFFLAMFTALLFIKIFHWLSQKRVEYIETTPTVSRLSHVRIIAFMVLLFIVDCIFLKYAVTHAVSHTMKNRRPSVLVLFAFEYVILASSTVATFLKYALYVADVVMDGQWDNKAVYIFYLELVRDLLHLFVYLVFFLIVFVYYGLPLHLVRDLYETFRNFRARVADFIRYRRITSNLNDRFLDATPEDLSRGDATCIICREEMTSAKKLPCGHLFHVHCLRSWLERQQTCPTCRSPLLGPENDAAAAAAAAGNGGRQQPLQPGAERGPAGVAHVVVNGQVHPPQHVHVLGQYAVAGNHGADLQAQMHAAVAAAAQYGMAAMYPPWRQGAPNWYPAVNPYGGLGQHPQQQQQQQQVYQHPLLHQYPPMQHPFLAPMAAPAPTVPAEGAPANGAVAASDPQPAASAGSANHEANSFGRPVNFAALSEAQAQMAARLQMQTSLAAAWTAQAQAQAQLAMGGWPYAGLPLYGMYPPTGFALHPAAGVGLRAGGEAAPGSEGGGSGERERPSGGVEGAATVTHGATAPANLAQMLMQLQYQTLAQLNPRAQGSPAQAAGPAVTQQPQPQPQQQQQQQQQQQLGVQAPAGTSSAPQLGAEAAGSQVAAEGSTSGVTTEEASSGAEPPPSEPLAEASTEEMETLRRRRLQRYGGESGRDGSAVEGDAS